MTTLNRLTFHLSQRLKNLSATLLLIITFGVFYASIPYYQRYFSTQTRFFGEDYGHWQVLLAFALSYTLILAVFYLTEKSPRISKSIYCWRAIKRLATSPRAVWQTGLPFDERLGLLSILLKAFFAPLMVVWLFSHTAHMLHHGDQLLQMPWQDPDIDWLILFNTNGFWFLFKLILFLDVLFFTMGYLIELPSLKNEIRSVDPTLLGWAVALASYPPFNGLTAMVFAGYNTDFPQFADPVIHVVMNVMVLILMAIFTSASIALNFKASNLTHRGIIMHGPYRFIRHPAYTCKNLAWWIGLLPAVLVASETSVTATLVTIGSMLGWSIIYLMRALTEEDHLRSVDDAYDQYCQKVKYRFIPGVI